MVVIILLTAVFPNAVRYQAVLLLCLGSIGVMVWTEISKFPALLYNQFLRTENICYFPIGLSNIHLQKMLQKVSLRSCYLVKNTMYVMLRKYYRAHAGCFV